MNNNPLSDAALPSRFVFANFGGQAGVFTPGTAFAPFASSTLGRNFFRGPGAWNFDAGLYKRFGLAEDMSLQLRAELYNLFNHANLLVPGNAVDINSTGYVPAFYSGRRQLQLAVKLVFLQFVRCTDSRRAAESRAEHEIGSLHQKTFARCQRNHCFN